MMEITSSLYRSIELLTICLSLVIFRESRLNSYFYQLSVFGPLNSAKIPTKAQCCSWLHRHRSWSVKSGAISGPLKPSRVLGWNCHHTHLLNPGHYKPLTTLQVLDSSRTF